MSEATSKNLSSPYQTNPPCYNMSKLTVSTALFTGGQDWLADPEDVALLIPLLMQNKILYSNISFPDYEHLDFIWGINANKDVYDVIIKDIIG